MAHREMRTARLTAQVHHHLRNPSKHPVCKHPLYKHRPGLAGADGQILGLDLHLFRVEHSDLMAGLVSPVSAR